jgi:glycosyltransferase involved in cell wall biosynthesis
MVILRAPSRAMAGQYVAVPTSVFFALRDSPERRAALRAEALAPERYRLFGLDQIARRSTVRHNLERARPPVWARATSAAINRAVYGLGGYGGDFASLLGSLRAINASEVVFSTVDTVGLPLALLSRAGIVRPPVVYTAIGLPERLVQLRGARTRRVYRDALRRTRALISYAQSEAEWLRDWLGAGAPPVRFIPFGVDTDAFRPQPDAQHEVDVVSVGADPRRDFGLLAAVARSHPDLTFTIVLSADHARALAQPPPNVTLEIDIPLEAVRGRLAGARVVALPVRGNSYSGATTTLLQAMAMAKPVVVSRTDAIATGYGLDDGINCRLVPPEEADAFERALLETLTGADAARALGIRARETVERSLSWKRYTDALWDTLSL